MRTPDRGEVYRLKQDEAGKPRPVVIVSRRQMNAGISVVVVPFTTQQMEKRIHQPSFVLFEAGEGGLTERCLAKCGDIGLIKISALQLPEGRLGHFDDAQMARLMDGVKWVLEIP
jgi:mRNA-degrading endonuclease toxin of MazEF toxin-antitoxin module